MHNIEKIRWVLLVFGFVMIIIYLVIPTIQESNREKRVTTQEVEDYIYNSKVIHLTMSQVQILDKKNHQSYNDANLSNRYTKRKNTLLLKDNKEGKFYLIESYYFNSFRIKNSDFKNKIYLVINKEHSRSQGTKDNPIIALRYYVNEEYPNTYISDKNYYENVREYLTYKDFTPSSMVEMGIKALVAAIIIISIVICTILMKRK